MKDTSITHNFAEKTSFGHRPMSHRGRGQAANSESAQEKKKYRIIKKVFPQLLLAKGLKNLQWEQMGDVQTPHYPGAAAEGAIFVYVWVCMCVSTCVDVTPHFCPRLPGACGPVLTGLSPHWNNLIQSLYLGSSFRRTGERNKEPSGQGNFFTGVLNLKIVGHFPGPVN